MLFTKSSVLAIVAAATAVVAAPSVDAKALFTRDNCNTGLTYCGYGLMNKGKYGAQISWEMDRAGQPHYQSDNTLFYCYGGADGGISYKQFCNNGCVDGGSGANDYCR